MARFIELEGRIVNLDHVVQAFIQDPEDVVCRFSLETAFRVVLSNGAHLGLPLSAARDFENEVDIFAFDDGIARIKRWQAEQVQVDKLGDAP